MAYSTHQAPGRWQRVLPFLGWIGELRKPWTLRADVVAGVTVALVLVPQAMAYGQLAGLAPYQGLYAAFLPVMVAALFGSSRQLSTGPTAVAALMTAAAVGPLAGGDTALYATCAVTLALLVGVLCLALGLFRLGMLVDFLSQPVVTGFTSAAALIIATSQLSGLLGVPACRAPRHYQAVWAVLGEAWQHTHLPTAGMACLALALMLALRRWAPRLPAVLVAAVVTALLAWSTGYAAAGGAVVGTIPAGLPALRLPSLPVSTIGDLVPAAVAVCLVGYIEAASIAKGMAIRTRQHWDADRELIGQGLANLAAGFSRGCPVSGSFSRSAVNLNAGAATGFSSVVAGLAVGVTLLWLTPLLYHLPQATLAAVIVMAVLNLVHVAPVRHAWRVQKHDAVVAVVTFAVTLAGAPHIDYGLVCGVVLALGLHLYRSMRPRFAELSLHPDGTYRDAQVHGLATCEAIALCRFDGRLYFASAGHLENRLGDLLVAKPGLRFVILAADGINEIDATGQETLERLVGELRSAGVDLLIVGAKKQITDVFARVGFYDVIGPDHVLRRCQDALAFAQAHVAGHDPGACPLLVPVPLASATDAPPPPVTADPPGDAA